MTEWVEQKLGEFWKPDEAGEELQGEIVGIADDEKFGKQYTIVTDEGKTSVTPSHAVLQSRLKLLKVGDYVRIIYDGKQASKTKGYKDMELYRVFVARKGNASLS